MYAPENSNSSWFLVARTVGGPDRNFSELLSPYLMSLIFSSEIRVNWISFFKTLYYVKLLVCKLLADLLTIVLSRFYLRRTISSITRNHEAKHSHHEQGSIYQLWEFGKLSVFLLGHISHRINVYYKLNCFLQKSEEHEWSQPSVRPIRGFKI